MTLTIAFALIPFAALAYQKSAGRSAAEKSEAASSKDVVLYDSDSAPQPYFVLGKFNVESYWPKRLSGKMKSLAKKYKADAVMKYKITVIEGVGAYTGAGIAVRYAEPDEKGLTKIPPDLPIPILQ